MRKCFECDVFTIHRRKSSPFHVVLVGGDELVSAAVQAVAHARGLSPGVLTFSIVPTGKKEMSERVKEDAVSVLKIQNSTLLLPAIWYFCLLQLLALSLLVCAPWMRTLLQHFLQIASGSKLCTTVWVSGAVQHLLLANLPPSPLHLPFLLPSPADPLLQYVQMAVHTTQFPLAQVALQMAPTEGGYEAHSATSYVVRK